MELPPLHPDFSTIVTIIMIIVTIATIIFDLHLLLRRQYGILARGFFTKRLRTTFTCALKITSIPKETKQVQRIKTRKDLEGAVTYTFQHLTSLWEGETSQISYEIHTHKNQVSIMFYTHQTQRNPKEAFQKAWINLQALKTSLQTNYPGIEVKPVEFHELPLLLQPLIPPPKAPLKKCKQSLQMQDEEGARYLSVVHLKNTVELMPREEATQIDMLIESLIANNIDARIIIHCKRRRKPRLKKEKIKRNQKEPPTIPQQMELADWYTDQVENRLGRTTGYWKVSAYIAIITQTENEAQIKARQVSHILTTIYSGPLYGPQIKILSGRKILKKLPSIASRRSIGKTADMPSTRLAALIHLPEKPLPGLETLTRAEFYIPPNTIFNYAREIPTALVLHKDREVYTCTLNPDDLCKGMAVLGKIGSGKTRFLTHLLKRLLIKRPQLPMLIFESKGEFVSLATIPEAKERVLVLRPGTEYAPLKINFFDPGEIEPAEYSRKLLGFLTEILENYFGSDSEFSPQMSRVLGEVLPEVIRNPSLRSFEGLFQTMDNYSIRNRETYTFVENTVLALKSRLELFRRGILKKVFDTQKTNISPEDLLNKIVVVDLGPFLAQGGTKDAVQIILGGTHTSSFPSGTQASEHRQSSTPPRG